MSTGGVAKSKLSIITVNVQQRTHRCTNSWMTLEELEIRLSNAELNARPNSHHWFIDRRGKERFNTIPAQIPKSKRAKNQKQPVCTVPSICCHQQFYVLVHGRNTKTTQKLPPATMHSVWPNVFLRPLPDRPEIFKHALFRCCLRS